MNNTVKTLIAFLVPVFLLFGIAWFVTDEKTVVVTEVVNRVPDMQYCYMSEDGDWLICRLKEDTK